MPNSDSNPIYALMNQALSSFFTFGVLILASRALPTNEFGIYSLLVLTLALFSLAPQAFVFMPMMSMSKDFSSLNLRIYSDFLILCLMLLISLGVGIVLYYFNLTSVGEYVSLGSLICWVVSFQGHEFLKRVLYISDRHRALVLYEIVKLVGAILALALLYFWHGKFDIDTILIGTTFAYLCFSCIAISRADFPTSFTINPIGTFAKNFAFGKWIFLGNGISYFQNNFFVFVTALLLPLETVAGLNAVRSLIGFSTVIFLAIDNYLAPKLAGVYQSEGLENLINKVISFYLRSGWIIAVIYVGIGLFSENLVTMIFGERYADSSVYLNYFLVVSFLGFMARPFLILSRTIHATKIIFWGSVGPAIFALVFSYPLIFTYGDIGAVSMAVLGSLLFLVSLAVCFWNYTITAD